MALSSGTKWVIGAAVVVIAAATIAGVSVQLLGSSDEVEPITARNAAAARTALARATADAVESEDLTVIAEATASALGAGATATARADPAVRAAEIATATSIARDADACLGFATGFSAYPLVAAGKEVAGARLMGCGDGYQDPSADPERYRTIEPSSQFTFEYAGCPPARIVGSCISVTIAVDPACGYTMKRAEVVETITIRGAEVFVTQNAGLRLETPTYNVSVTASGEEPGEDKARAAAVMRALVGVNASAASLTADAPLSTRLDSLEVCE